MNPWSALPDSAPFVLPADLPIVREFNRNAHPLQLIRTEAIPEPFFGRFDAPVVVLLLNPGFSADGRHIPESPAFLRAMRAYLATGDADHLHLTRDASGPGHAWWMRGARALVDATSRATVAQSLLSLECMPYHSIKFGHARLRLPSQSFTFALLRAALSRKAVVVAARGFRIWCDAVPELTRYDRVLHLRSPQRFSMSPRNLGEPGFRMLRDAVAPLRLPHTLLRNRRRAVSTVVRSHPSCLDAVIAAR